MMMNEVLHANIFFFIASIATVVFCIISCFILFHVLKIVRAIRRIVERVDAGSEIIANDIAQLREFIASGSVWGRVVQFLMSFGGAGRTRKKRSPRQE